MPFYPLYKDFFREGDLVYGLSHVRSLMYTHFFDDIEKYSRGVWTVDNYRPSTVADKLHLSHAISVPKFYGGFDKTKAQEKLKLKEDAAYIKQHLAKFQDDVRVHSKYSRYGDLLKHFDFQEERFAEALKSKESVTNDAWRAKSKFGIEWTVKKNIGKNRTEAQGFIHIHFVLDDIDMAAVVTKTHQFEKDGVIMARDFPRGKGKTITEKKERTITHSELRWIYRNRKNPLVQDSIQFWLKNKPCSPPWENDTEETTLPSGRTMPWKYAWLAYKPSMEHETFD